jgi:hypothetical protein
MTQSERALIPIVSVYDLVLSFLTRNQRRVITIRVEVYFSPDKINVKSLERIVTELDHWNLKIEDTGKVERLAGESIFKEIKRVRAERHNVKRIERLNRLFPVMKKLKLDPNLHQSQNLYFETSVENKANKVLDLPEEWISQFNLLGDNLGVKVE